MRLESVWFKKGKEIYRVDPVMNVLCDDDMKGISDIEIYNGIEWYSISDIGDTADDFVIRIVKD